MANPHQQHPPFPYGVNPAPNPSGVQQPPFYAGAAQPMTNPAMLAALQQARYVQMKQQQQQQQQAMAINPSPLGPGLPNANPNMAFNPAQLQLNPQHANQMQNPAHQFAAMTSHERIAQAKAMAQHQAQAQQSHPPSQYAEQQQQYGYDARMMPPPPPPAQQQQHRPPSTRPGTAGSGGIPRSQSQSAYVAQQQQYQQQGQRFPPMHSFDAQPPTQAQGYPQQQLPQQQFASHPPANVNMGSITPAQLQQLHAHPQPQAPSHLQAAQAPHLQPPPHPQDPRVAQLQALQAQSQLHPQSPATRKRKLPAAAAAAAAAPSGSGPLPAPDPAPAPAASSAANINPNVQRMATINATDPFAAPRSVAPTNPQALALSLNPAITRVTTIPLAGSGAIIPALSAAEIQDMQTWMTRDKAYERAWTAGRERAVREVAEAARAKVGWWEDGDAPKGRKGEREHFGILWPEHKRAERARKLKRAGVRWEGIRL